MKKILLANRPSLAKRGQYTFEDDGVTNAGVYSSFNKFIKKDLYTFSENESMNQTIVNAGTYHFSSDSFLRINRLRIDNTGQGKDKKNVSVKIWMWVQRKSDFTAEYVSSNNIGTRQEIWYKNYGDESEGWSPGTIINNSKLLENFGEGSTDAEYNENWSPNVVPSWDYVSEVDDVSTSVGQIGLRYLMEDPLSDLPIPEGTNQKLYIAVKMTGDQDGFFTDDLDDRYQYFEMDLDEVQEHPEGEVEFEFSANDNVHRYDEGGGSWFSNQAAAYVVNELSVTIKRPMEVAEIDNPDLVNILYAVTPPPRIEEYNQLLYYKLNPYNLIRWNDSESTTAEKLKISPDALNNYNWRPISIVKVNNIDTQAYYTDDDVNIKISAPTSIELSLSIGDDNVGDMQEILNFDIYKNYSSDATSGQGKISDIKYKFCVLDWNDKEDKITDFDYIYKFIWPTTELEMLEKRRNEDTFNFENVVWNGTDCSSSGCTNPIWQSGILKHTYSEPGIKSVKLMVFSYCLNTDGFTIQAIEWKLVTIRFNLTKDLVYQDDFHEIGGADFKVLPWPHTTPIIGGVDTENSLYFNSIDKVFSEGKFLETDIIDEDMLLDSIENDELGSYTGDIDIEQVRLFKTGVYDMNTLLGIGETLHYLDNPMYVTESSCIKLRYSETGEGYPGDDLNWSDLVTDCSSTIDSICINPCPGGPLAGQCTGPTSGYAQCGCGGDSDGDGYGDSLPTALCDDGLLHCNCNLDPSTGEYYIYEDSWEYDIETIYVVTECMTSSGTQYVLMISNGELIYATGDETCVTLITSEDEPEQTLQFIPYTKLDYWNGDQHQFPQESCVGTLFINDNMDKELRSKCLLELNTGTSDNTFIRDTSGNGNKGILIGDFKVKKESELVSMTRDSLIIKPNTGTKDGAL